MEVKDPEKYKKLKNPSNVKKMLKKRNLSIKGEDSVLWERLKEALVNEYSTTYDSDGDDKQKSDDNFFFSLIKSDEEGKFQIDPIIHIADTTLDYQKADEKERAIHSTISHSVRQKEKRRQTVKKGNEKIHEGYEKEEKLKTESGVFPCPVLQIDTMSKCILEYATKEGLERHIQKCQEGAAKHVFPKFNSVSKTLNDASKGLHDPLNLCVGGRTNRDTACFVKRELQNGRSIEQCNGCLGKECPNCKANECNGCAGIKCLKCNGVSSLCFGEGCYRRDFKLLKKEPFRASAELLKDLEVLFQEGENREENNKGKKTKKTKAGKYTHTEAVAILMNLKIGDRRKYRPGGEFGPLPTANYVRSWFSIRKRKGAKALSGSGDKFDGMSLDKMKSAFEQLFGIKPSKKNVLQKILEADDHLQDGGHDNTYSLLQVKDIEKECKARNLPYSVSAKALKITLRAYQKENDTAAKTRVEQISTALEDEQRAKKIIENEEDQQDVGMND